MSYILGVKIGHEDSSRPVISDIDSPNQHSDDTDTSGPSHGDHTDLDKEDPNKRPKW